MSSLLMPSPPISISHRLFRCRYSNSRDVIASSPSFSQSAPESLLADYFLRTPSAPITTGVVSISILHLLVLSRYGQYQRWLTTGHFKKYLVDLTSLSRRPLHSPRQLQVHQSWWVLLSLYSWPVDSFNFES